MIAGSLLFYSNNCQYPGCITKLGVQSICLCQLDQLAGASRADPFKSLCQGTSLTVFFRLQILNN